MTAISTWSTTAASNNMATPDGWPEGQAPSTVNNCAREMMAMIRTWYEQAEWSDFGLTPTRVSGTQFTVVGDYTLYYLAGRAVKMTGSATAYGTVSTSAYSAPNTTVTLTASVVPATLTTVSLHVVSGLSSLVGTSVVVNGATVPSNGLYLSAANTVALASNTTLRWSVNSTGNHVFAAASGGTAGIALAQGSATYGYTLTAGAGTAAVIEIASNAGAIGTASLSVGQDGAGAAVILQRANLALSLGTNGITRVTIAAGGAVAFSGQVQLADGVVGTPSVAFANDTDTGLYLLGTNAIGFATNGAVRAGLGATGSWQWHAYGAGTLTTDGSGNVTAVSDERAKSNIRPYNASLAAILRIRPIQHGYTEESGLDQTKRDYAGFSAQNVQEVLPEAVGCDRAGMLTLSDRPIIAALVNAVQELAKRTYQ